MKSLIYKLVYLFIYMPFGLLTPVVLTYLEDVKGLSSSLSSNILSFSILFSLILLPILGIINDKTQKNKITFLIILSIINIVLFLFINSTVIFLVVTFAILFDILKATIAPMNDSIVSVRAEKDNFSYASCRVMGSLGFILGGLLSNLLIRNFNDYNYIYYTVLLLYSISLLLVLFFYKDTKRETNHKYSIKESIPKIFKNKKFLIYILIAITGFTLTNGVMYYIPDYLVELGLSRDQVGFNNLSMASLEILIMPFMLIIITKIGYKNSFLIGILATTIRLILFLFIDNPILFLIAQSLHGVSVSFIIPTMFRYISRHIELEANTTAVMIYSTLSGLSLAIFIRVTNSIIDITDNIINVFLLHLLLCLISLVLLLFVKKEENYVN